MKEINYNKLICQKSGLKLRAVQAIKKDNPKRYRELKNSALLDDISIDDEVIEYFYQTGITGSEILNSLTSSEMFKKAIDMLDSKFVPTINREQLENITERVQKDLSDLRINSQRIEVFPREDSIGQFQCISTAYNKYRYEAVYINKHSAYKDILNKNNASLVTVSELSRSISYGLKIDKNIQLSTAEERKKTNSVPFTMDIECNDDFVVQKETVTIKMNNRVFMMVKEYNPFATEVIYIDGIKIEYNSYNISNLHDYILDYITDDNLKSELLKQYTWLDNLISKLSDDEDLAKDQYGDYRDIGVESAILLQNIISAAMGEEKLDLLEVELTEMKFFSKEYAIDKTSDSLFSSVVSPKQRDIFKNGKATITETFKY